MKQSIKSIVVLVVICMAVAVLLALTNSITAPIIENNQNQQAFEALLEVLPNGGSFTTVNTGEMTLPSTVSEVYSASNGGYVFKLTTTGYSSGLVIMLGINPDGTVAGSKIIASQETPSIGGVAAESYKDLTVGASIDTIDSVDTVAGATKTTEAYRSAIKDALNAVIILGGGSVDIRTEEEILQDNLEAALPSAEGEFTKHFFIEVVEGVDAVYMANNGTGAVCVIGETFVGVDAEGQVVSECTAEEATTATAAMATVNSTTTTDVDITQYEGLPKQLISVKLTDKGVYVVEIKGVGYGIKGGNEYHPASGEYIIIRVSIANGRIVDCLTVSQAETNGLGSACADEKFYGQFDGKTEENYADIDVIVGATMTTDGYKEAIMRAFASLAIINGDK